MAADGVVRFDPDLDRSLQRCEDGLLAGAAHGTVDAPARPGEALAGMPPQLRGHLGCVSLPKGTALIRQGEPPDDVFVLESGRLRVEMVTSEGTRVRLRTLRAGVVVGEISLHTSAPRTADVIAETPCVVLRIGRAELERMETHELELAAALHRWFATMLAERLGDALNAYDALLD